MSSPFLNENIMVPISFANFGETVVLHGKIISVFGINLKIC